MPKTIDVSPEMLNSAAKEIEGLTDEYKKQYDALYTEVDSLGAKWKGKDTAAFTARVDGFKDDFEKMRSLMLSYADYLKKAAKTYQQAQDDIEGAAKTLRN